LRFANLSCKLVNVLIHSDVSYSLLAKPTKFICCFFVRGNADRNKAMKLDALTKESLRHPGLKRRLLLIGLNEKIYSRPSSLCSVEVTEHQLISGLVVNPGMFALCLATDYTQPELLSRAYSLALPRTIGPANLAMSIDDLLSGPDVYSTPVESVDVLREKLGAVSVEKRANLDGREVVTFDWPGDGRIKHPARGESCKHVQCFDLEVTDSSALILHRNS
jgi:hypothetical protein